MTISEHFRNSAFWLRDKLHGGKVAAALDILNRIEGEHGMSDRDIEAYHDEQLIKLLRHCVETVPAYSELGCLLDSAKPINKWPVVNKSMLKNGGEVYMSDKYDRQNLVSMSTSGSTGTPFTCWQDAEKKRHVNAEVLFYTGKLGYKVGQRLIYFRSVVKNISKSSLKQLLHNIFLIDCKDLTDEGIRSKLSEIKRLSANGGTYILSYASTLDAFRKYFEKHGTDEARQCKVLGIISGSEMLQDITRESMAKAFGCKVVSRYSNEENGFLAQDDKENNVFIHNRANYYIEILKLDSDEPAEMGQIGRVVLTDLYNYAMPMVRYDTGDVGAWQEVTVNGVKRRAIGQFGGRKVDMIFDCKGNAISPHAVTNNMWKYPFIKQFQFIQEDSGIYTLRINTDNPVDEGELINTYKAIVGQDASITIEYCDEIPVLASGKRRYIVNKMRAAKNQK